MFKLDGSERLSWKLQFLDRHVRLSGGLKRFSASIHADLKANLLFLGESVIRFKFPPPLKIMKISTTTP